VMEGWRDPSEPLRGVGSRRNGPDRTAIAEHGRAEHRQLAVGVHGRLPEAKHLPQTSWTPPTWGEDERPQRGPTREPGCGSRGDAVSTWRIVPTAPPSACR
jgi:hypothetical protein